jgi:hypothetical protein
VNRALYAVAAVGLFACETVEVDLPGHLVHVEVVRVSDTCAPQRLVGDGGTQFLATRPDGGLAFTWPVAMQWGPLVDGGLSLLGERDEQVPAVAASVTLGSQTTCVGEIVTEADDAGIAVTQRFPDACRPAYFTSGSCSVTRRLVLTPVQACSSACVRYDPATGEATCAC